jgi:hypothetical protein
MSHGPRLKLDTQSIENHFAAQRLRDEIAALNAVSEAISTRFKTYGQASVEEQLAIRMAFLDNRARLGEVSRKLLRLVCMARTTRP